MNREGSRQKRMGEGERKSAERGEEYQERVSIGGKKSSTGEQRREENQ